MGATICMATLIIDRDFATFMEDECHGFRNRTDLFLGNALAMLQEHFPSVSAAGADAVAANIIGAITKTTKPMEIWGFREYGGALLEFQQYLGERTSLSPSMQDIERTRIRLGIQNAPMPTSIFDESAGIRFENLASVSAVLWSMLYYHAFMEQKLVRCKHCGRWFATITLKSEYCSRTSPCYGTLLRGKKRISCKGAVDKLKDGNQYMRKSIENKARAATIAQAWGNDFLREFQTEANKLQDAARECPSPENLRAYHDFLRDTNKARAWLVRGDANNAET